MKEGFALVVSGLPGVGKTTASYFFKRKGIPVLRMGRITDRFLKNCGLAVSEKNEQHLRENLRKKFGVDVYAKEMIEAAIKKRQKHPLIVIEGARSLAEVNYFKNKRLKVQILFINTPKTIRYKRLVKRKVRSLIREQIRARDLYEKSLGVMELRKIAHFYIENKGTKADFYENLNRVVNNYDRS